MSEPYLDQTILRSLLHYDQSTGGWRWLRRKSGPKCWNTRYADKAAGRPWSDGKKGVSRRLSDGRFRATIQARGKWCEIGVYDTAEEANAAYEKTALLLAGEFARAR